ncbi:MAG: LemA family protein [Clostridiales bacterium]|mgnify:CR=1 FL=1|nr:LemA family protein [Clostridiales bacterium]
MPFLWIFLGLIVVVVLWAISLQRTLVGMDELCGNALSTIGVQQNSRWDALTGLAQLVRNYSAHEADTLQKVIAMRRPITAASTPADVQGQENALMQTLTHLMAVGEAYPDLKANTLYLNTMDSLNKYEDNVRKSRMVYNDTVTKLNRTVRMFPGSLIAGMLGFRVRDYLETESPKTQMPSF